MQASSLDRSLNWQYIVKVAGRNGLLPLVSSNLLRKCSDLLDEEIREGLSEFLSDHTRNNFFQTKKVIEICETLEAAGIPVLPFKGPTLAMQAYGDISLRQFVDLDILVQPRHFDRAVTILERHGYLPIEKVTWLKRKSLFFTRKKDLGLVSADGQVRVELHWKLSGTHFAMPLEIDQLWQRMEILAVAGTDLRSLPFADLLVYLCLHGSRHGWSKFQWISDINELTREVEKPGAKIDWFEVRNHARKHGCEKALELGLFLIERFLGKRTGYPEFDRIIKDKVFNDIAGSVSKHAFADHDRSMEMGQWYSYHLSLKEKMSDRFRVHLVYLVWYLRIAIRPNEVDEAVFKLPALFYPLYYVIRPVRLTLTRLNNKPG
jgi:hypothetical protein